MELDMWSRYIHTESKKVPDINRTKKKYLPPEDNYQDLEAVTVTSNVKTQKKPIRDKKNQENMASWKTKNSHPVTKLKNMQFCDLTNKEFKIAVLKKQWAARKQKKTIQLNQKNNIEQNKMLKR